MNPGTTIEGRFLLERPLGEGGMGVVWLAHDLTLDKPVAIKTLLPKMVTDHRAVEQLKKEVRISQELRHPHICATYDFHDRGDHPFLVMEYVDGETLSNYTFKHSDNRIGEVEFRRIAVQILDAVGHAHSKGIVHRDLKSGNIMITSDGEVRVMDFGIAASLKETYSRTTGAPVSLSIHFASPEQINGAPPSASMDVYSLGCVFYEMLSGEPPFKHGDILHQQLTRLPDAIQGASADLNRIVLACLAKDPKKRLASCGEVVALLSGNQTIKVGAQARLRTFANARRVNWVALTWASAAVLALTGAALFWWQSHANGSGGPFAARPAEFVSTPTPQPGSEHNSALTPAERPPAATTAQDDELSRPERKPPDMSARIAHGRELLNAGAYAGAIAAFRAVLKADSGNVSAQTGLRDAQAAFEAENNLAVGTGFDEAATLRQANEKRSSGVYEDAIKLYQVVLDHNASNGEARRGLNDARSALEAERKVFGKQ
jgi:predicted Ser/Thr protein kinase